MSTSTYPISPPEGSTLKVALCQTLCVDDKAQNLRTVEAALKSAVDSGAQLVVLPEMWNCPYANSSFGPYSEVLPSPTIPTIPSVFSIPSTLVPTTSPTSLALSSLASRYGVWLIAGSIPERDPDDGRLYNSSLVLNPDGHFVAKHRKVHLFDIDVPGQMTFRESDTLSAGSHLTTFDSPWGRVGLGICYDIRFPEYAQALTATGCGLLVYPGAFNTTTGPLHWELLARARAVDCQSFVLVCSPARNPASTYQAWGHSSVVSPWGKVLATTEHEPAVVVCELQLDEIAQFRQRIPTSKQKRPDCYHPH